MIKSTSMLFVLLVIILSPVSAQWTQIGVDIDGEAIGDESGWSVSLSSDGSIMAVGAPDNDGSGADAGHARVYKNISGTWTQQGADINGEAADDLSGESIDLSGDGLTVAVGAIRNDGNGSNSGHVRVYKFISGSWVQQGADINGEASFDYSGHSVSLSDDGLIVAVGAANNDATGIDAGHVRVYKLISGAWVQQGTDLDGEAAGDRFGEFINLNSDGLTIAIGASRNDGNGLEAGHVRVFKFVSGAWIQQGTDIDGEAAGDASGESVSLSSDGLTVAIGAPHNDGLFANSGHARVFKLIAGAWVQQGADIDAGGGVSTNGESVSLSADGLTLAVSAAIGNGGHTRVFKFNSGNWTQHLVNINAEANSDLSGVSISLSADGSTLAIGAPFNDGNGNSSGHVRVFLGSLICTSGATNTIDTEIDNVTFNTINQSSANNCTGYTNYTSVSTAVTLGQSYTLSISTGDCDGGTVYARAYTAYIDWNGDSDYTDAGETVFAQANTTTNLSGSITVTVPFTAVAGSTTMRIVCTEGGVTGPCGNYAYGETEDYTVNIQGFCASNATSTIDSKIDRVRLVGNSVTIDQSSVAATCETYTSYFNVAPADLTINGSYTVEVTQGTCGLNYVRNCNVWIDFNNNGSFFDAGEMLSTGVLTSNVTPFTYNINFTVPAGAVSGDVAMRVIVKESGASTDPCAIYTWGETEDYVVTIQPACSLPVASTTGNSRCGTGTVSLSATPGAGGTTCKWYTAAAGGVAVFTGTAYTTPSITITTTYYVSTLNGSCETTSRTAAVATINSLPATPTISAGGPIIFCTGGSVTLSSSASTGNQWSLNGTPIGGATNQTFVATASGNYTVITTSGCSSLASSATTVTVNSLPTTPTILAGGPIIFCAGNSVTLSSSALTGNQWSLNGTPIGGATNQTFVATASGNYTVITTMGCSSLASITTTVTVNSLPATPTISAGGPITFCTGNSVTLSSSASAGNQWALNGAPIGGATNQTLVVTAAGNYTVITTSGCSSLASIATVVTTTIVSGSQVLTECTGFSITINGNTYTSTGIYTDILLGGGVNGCDSTLTTDLTVLAPLTGSVTNTICNGDNIIVNGTTYNAANPTGTEVFTIIGPNNCDSTVTVNLTVVLVVDITVTDTLPTLTANQIGATYQWLDCDNGNTIIAGETGQAFTAATSGNYAVEITVGSCVDTSACTNVIITGVNKYQSSIDDYQVYPNPTKGMFTVELTQVTANSSITVYDMLGKTIANRKSVTMKTLIDLTGNDKGVYFIQIQTEKENIVRKVVLQ